MHNTNNVPLQSERGEKKGDYVHVFAREAAVQFVSLPADLRKALAAGSAECLVLTFADQPSRPH